MLAFFQSIPQWASVVELVCGVICVLYGCRVRIGSIATVDRCSIFVGSTLRLLTEPLHRNAFRPMSISMQVVIEQRGGMAPRSQWSFRKSSTTDRKRSGLSTCMAWLAFGITTVSGKFRHFLISS